VPLVPTLSQPSIGLKVIPGGVVISWQTAAPASASGQFQTSYFYRVMRRTQGTNEPVNIGQVAAVGLTIDYLDSGIEWQKTYGYSVVPITAWKAEGRSGEVAGIGSAELTILANDIFPPATPSGLQAVFSGQLQQPGMDLTWRPNTDEDLAGYNVYRQTGNEPAARINSALVKTPSFHDGTVQLGVKYSYSVTAVDLRGNESGRSEQVAEAVPQQR
jgi:hypothetical protein